MDSSIDQKSVNLQGIVVAESKISHPDTGEYGK